MDYGIPHAETAFDTPSRDWTIEAVFIPGLSVWHIPTEEGADEANCGYTGEPGTFKLHHWQICWRCIEFQ